MTVKNRKKIAIIGGGCAAMSAAWDLSSPEQKEQFDITVYQLGWRLGGKGASGRGVNGRIEEHGLHLWMGFYENAFKVMRDAYAELDRDPDKFSVATFEEAFSPLEVVGIIEQSLSGEWSIWNALLPMDDGVPGDPLELDNPFSVRYYVRRLLSLIRTMLSHYYNNPEEYFEAQKEGSGKYLTLAQVAALAWIVHAIRTIEDMLEQYAKPVNSMVMPVFDTLTRNAMSQLRKAAGSDASILRVWALLDITFAATRGMFADNLITDERGFDAISHYDCREWLKKHGAADESLNTGYMRGLYDLLFAYADGNPETPSVDAGQALRGIFRSLFNYRGAFFWKMHGGMGDIVFTPLYEVLRKRGVKFEFFHRFTDLELGDDGSKHVKALKFDIQAEVKGEEYLPLVDVKGMPCWPSDPLGDQISDPTLKKGEKRDYEDFWDKRKVATKKLKVGKDFDFVVLGIGLGAVPYTCKELVESDSRWRTMVKKVKTIPTQAFQLWMNTDMTEMGWDGPDITASGFVEPFDTWADMAHLIPLEDWGTEVKSIAYFCNVFPEPGEAHQDHKAVREAVFGNVVHFLEQDLQHIWPACLDDNAEFKWQCLAGQDVLKKNEHPFASQYWRANINPTDRYTQSIPGSAAYRISPLDDKYDNFTICGDWTDCGFNVGCVEAAVMSGRLASHALSGYPALEQIVAYDFP